jgi:histidyl-tRNA synthetase
VANRLRGAGRRVELILGSPKLKRVIADADRDEARNLWMLGPDEVGRGVVKRRELDTGVESEEDITSFTPPPLSRGQSTNTRIEIRTKK